MNWNNECDILVHTTHTLSYDAWYFHGVPVSGCYLLKIAIDVIDKRYHIKFSCIVLKCWCRVLSTEDSSK